MHHAIGLIELNSIAKGIEAGDAMLKTAEVTLLVAKTICPGKYIVMVGGDVAAVQRSVAAGAGLAEHVLVDQFVIANIHASILPSISGVTPIDEMRAVGVVETYSVGACIESADAAVKAANVVPIRTHLAFGIGGKCYYVLTGDVNDVNTAVNTGAGVAGDKGLLVQHTIIPRPHRQLVEALL
ncbi:BMC domain-containing protein [Propionivibrio sp.]|uniref:BMC domain-containing protein n=1 Tax=Propionivibrio sp. TaxID=2212460 RepID=UPI0039E42B46